MPERSLSNKLALVTGASGAIGSAIAKRLALDGASVIAHYGTDAEGAKRTVRAIDDAGGEAEAFAADLGERDGASDVIAHLDRAFAGRFRGRLDILVNNAGMLDFGELIDVTDESFDRSFTVNVRACFQLAREAARRMTPAGWGRIVNIGSVFGATTPSAGLSVYCGTKFAVAGLGRAWSRDLGPAGITVNNVLPALIQTEPLPQSGPAFDAMQRFGSVGRFGSAADIARAVAFLVNPEAGYINGASFSIDGGWSA